jgi:DNA anti-recombination protein RmuC
MRTTIEITNAQRAALLELAAKRGEKGFSRLVQQAIDHMLTEESSRHEQIARALDLAGSFSDRSADALEKAVGRIRGTWR